MKSAKFSQNIIVISGALLLLALFSTSCGGGGGGGHPKPPPPPPPPVKPLARIGYSLPNSWQLVNAPAFAQALQAAKLGLTEIEWAPFIDAPQICHGTTKQTYPAQGIAFVQAMCARGITTFVNIVNANACAQTNESDQWFLDRIAEVKALPAQCVIVGAVSEPGAANLTKMKHWTDLARARFTTPFVLPFNKGAPQWGGIAYDYLDNHPCNRASLEASLGRKNPKLLTNSDCGPMLNPGPVEAKRWTALAVANGAPLLVYDFRARAFDAATIKAMGEAIP